MANKSREEYYVRSVQRALRILNCFSIEKPAMGVTEISKELGLHKSIVHALLITMEDEGFVQKDSVTNQYFMTYKVFRLGNIVAENIELKEVALPFMTRLRDATGESVALNIIHDQKRLVIGIVESLMPIRLFIHVGQILYLHCSAAGKSLLAWQAKETVDEIIESQGLPQMTPNTITDSQALKEDLQNVLKQGYAFCDGEGVWDAGSVAAPIFDHTGTMVASISIYGPLNRYHEENLREFIEHTKGIAAEISRSLGYNERDNRYYRAKEEKGEPSATRKGRAEPGVAPHISSRYR